MLGKDASGEAIGADPNYNFMNSSFELLQVSLGTRDRLSRVPSDAQWGELLEESLRQAVTGVLLSGIERLPQEQRPPIELK